MKENISLILNVIIILLALVLAVMCALGDRLVPAAIALLLALLNWLAFILRIRKPKE